MNAIITTLLIGIAVTGFLSYFLGVRVGVRKERLNGESYRDYILKSLGEMAQELYVKRDCLVVFKTGSGAEEIDINVEGQQLTFTVNDNESPSMTRKNIWKKVTRCIKEKS